MHVFVCVCMYVCMYVYVGVYVCVYVCICMCVCMYVCMYVCMCVCMFLHVLVYINSQPLMELAGSYHVLKSSPVVLNLIQLNPVHTLTTCSFSSVSKSSSIFILIWISHVHNVMESVRKRNA
jgi:hypothetical protein